MVSDRKFKIQWKLRAYIDMFRMHIARSVTSKNPNMSDAK